MQTFEANSFSNLNFKGAWIPCDKRAKSYRLFSSKISC